MITNNIIKEIPIPLEDMTRVEDMTTHNDSSIFVHGDNVEQGQGYEQIDLKIEKDDIFNNDATFGDLMSKKKPQKIGNLYVFLYNKEGDPSIVIGPHWPFFVCLSSTISMITFLFFYFLSDIITTPIKLAGLFFYFSQIFSYSYTFMKNPGIPQRKRLLRKSPNKVNSGFKFCEQCHIIVNQEENTSHCDDCNVCIIGYDHHCPWTSKCIGKGNLKEFYIFITFTMIYFGYLIFAISMLNVYK